MLYDGVAWMPFVDVNESAERIWSIWMAKSFGSCFVLDGGLGGVLPDVAAAAPPPRAGSETALAIVSDCEAGPIGC